MVGIEKLLKLLNNVRKYTHTYTQNSRRANPFTAGFVRQQQINRVVASSAPITSRTDLETTSRPLSVSQVSSPRVIAGPMKPFASPKITHSTPDVVSDLNATSFDVQHLLEQEEGRVTEPKRGKVYGWKLKSKAFFSKPFRRVKKLQHASSVASLRSLTDLKIFSPASSLRNSMSDLQSVGTKPVRRGSGMTALLVKSIMVTPLVEPLDSITEHNDSPITSRKQSIHCRIDSCPNIVELPLDEFSERGALSSMNVSTTSISTGCASSMSDSEENDDDDEEEDDGNTSATMPSEPETVSDLFSVE